MTLANNTMEKWNQFKVNIEQKENLPILKKLIKHLKMKLF